jgi:hypothetical protein
VFKNDIHDFEEFKMDLSGTVQAHRVSRVLGGRGVGGGLLTAVLPPSSQQPVVFVKVVVLGVCYRAN